MNENTPPYWYSIKGRIMERIVKYGEQSWNELLENLSISKTLLNTVLSEMYNLKLISKTRDKLYRIPPYYFRKYQAYLSKAPSESIKFPNSISVDINHEIYSVPVQAQSSQKQIYNDQLFENIIFNKYGISPEELEDILIKDKQKKKKENASENPKLYFSRWIKKKKIGRGGQGNIFLIKDEKNELEDRVLKSMYIFNNYEKKIKRFEREIETLKNIKDNPHFIQIFDYDQEPTNISNQIHYYYSMEKADFDLEQLLKKEYIPIIERLDLFEEILEGVKYIHTALDTPIIHRDLKPKNILIKEKTVKIADFGICLPIDNTRETKENERVGPYYYMAPELEGGKRDNIDVKADYYSLGKILYFLLNNGKKHLLREHYNNSEFPNYNLALLESNTQLKLFNSFFAKTITEKPDYRFASFNELEEEFKKIKGKFIGNGWTVKCPKCYSLDLEKFDEIMDGRGEDGMTDGQIAEYLAGNWGTYTCLSCGHEFDFER